MARSWCTAAALFILRISLFSRCLAVCTEEAWDIEQAKGEKAKERATEGCEQCGGAVAVAILDSLYEFYELHIQSTSIKNIRSLMGSQ